MSRIKELSNLNAMKITECPKCKSKDIEISVYTGGKRFIECLGCYYVIASIKPR
jgi:hypothetical protein